MTNLDSVSTITFDCRGPKNHLRKDLHLSELSSDDEESEDGGSHNSPKQGERVEQDSYKTSYEFKTKMFTSMRSQRTSLCPLFKLRDLVAKVKLQVDELWISVGLLSFRMVTLKLVTLAGERKMSLLCSNDWWSLPR